MFCGHIFWTPIFVPTIEHYEGGVNLGYDLGKFFIVIKLQNIWLDSNAKIVNFLTYIKTWQQANTLQIEIQRNSGGDKEKLDGSNTIYPILITGGGLKEIEKMPADQEVYQIKNITAEQRGTAS